MKYNLAFIGFGVVGQGLTEILLEKRKYLKDKYDFEWEIVAVSDTIKGSCYSPDGLDAEELLKLAPNNELNSYKGAKTGWDSLKTIKSTNAHIIIEVTYTDIETGEPALTHFKTAFKSGKHLATTNKGPVALAYRELMSLAKEKNLQFRFEGTVLAGTPTINLVRDCLAGCEIAKIQGILNGTTNYILTRMEEGMDYETALKKAQELGYAEADPTADVEGFDALAKVIILSNSLMDGDLEIVDAYRDGITEIKSSDIEKAKGNDERYKLIGTIERDGDRIDAGVRPERIPLTHPLASVMEATNALTFTTDLLGDVTIVGPGAGKSATGFSLLTDILDIHRSLS